DVLVVGGGIVGCTLACRLAQDLAPRISSSSSSSGPPPGEEETRPPPPLLSAMGRDGPDPRVYSLAPSSVKVLREVGVWD
ncbi:unnamed protein product, partial [Hapterophycus canaliculatus]